MDLPDWLQMFIDGVPAFFQGLIKYAPLLTLLIAATAACIALMAIWTQKAIARKRAAIDLFLKTEMDSHMLNAHAAYMKGVAALSLGVPMEEFANTQAYRDIRSYLNVHEVIALGVRKKVLDDTVSYHYWSGELGRAWKACQRVIAHAQSQSGPGTYWELTELYKEWSKRHNEWDIAISRVRRSNPPPTAAQSAAIPSHSPSPPS